LAYVDAYAEMLCQKTLFHGSKVAQALELVDDAASRYIILAARNIASEGQSCNSD
jgi:hypothetical protein